MYITVLCMYFCFQHLSSRKSLVIKRRRRRYRHFHFTTAHLFISLNLHARIFFSKDVTATHTNTIRQQSIGWHKFMVLVTSGAGVWSFACCIATSEYVLYVSYWLPIKLPLSAAVTESILWNDTNILWVFGITQCCSTRSGIDTWLHTSNNQSAARVGTTGQFL